MLTDQFKLVAEGVAYQTIPAGGRALSTSGGWTRPERNLVDSGIQVTAWNWLHPLDRQRRQGDRLLRSAGGPLDHLLPRITPPARSTLDVVTGVMVPSEPERSTTCTYTTTRPSNCRRGQIGAPVHG